MENKVGDNNPSAAEVTQILGSLGASVDLLKKFCITLGKDQRKRLLHARLGAEPHIARVYDLSVKYGIKIANIPLAGMVADLALFTMLRPIQDVLRAALRMVDDTAGQAESEAWQAFLAYYGALSGMAKSVPELATELSPTVEFMATGPRPKPANEPGGDDEEYG
ncbi:MAG: hypothetical protein QM820_28565 [Minicystis sp.]